MNILFGVELFFSVELVLFLFSVGVIKTFFFAEYWFP